MPRAMFNTDELHGLVDLMVQTMRAAPGVGLAAPQIGIPLRVRRTIHWAAANPCTAAHTKLLAICVQSEAALVSGYCCVAVTMALLLNACVRIEASWPCGGPARGTFCVSVIPVTLLTAIGQCFG